VIILTGILACLLAATHLAAAWLPAMSHRNRRRWMSFAGGVAASFVFLHMIPELYEQQRVLGAVYSTIDVFVVALVGACAYYSMERLVQTFRLSSARDRRRVVQHRIFWTHIGSFVLYNMLIGYILLERDSISAGAYVLYAVAMALHLLVNDFALEEHHRKAYRRKGRWLLAAAILVGWGLSLVLVLPAAMVAMLFAFLAGGLIVNIFKEELPGQRQGRAKMFVAGAGIYAVLLMSM
jgi:zinc transporter ZupT